MAQYFKIKMYGVGKKKENIAVLGRSTTRFQSGLETFDGLVPVGRKYKPSWSMFIGGSKFDYEPITKKQAKEQIKANNRYWKSI